MNDRDKFLKLVAANYKDGQRDKIIAAYDYAKSAHGEQKRESGEEYISHPTAVAEILIGLGMDHETIIASLLHDVLEDTKAPVEEIEKLFGDNVLNIVQGVTKLTNLKFKSQEEEKAENLRKMFLAMSNDIRIIVVKLADRLHNMRTLSFKNEVRQKQIAQETLDIYAPIAARLGIAGIKSELEDLSLRYIHPEEYYDIVNRVASKRTERQEFVDKVVALIEKKLVELDIDGEVHGRPKHFYSIYKKMKGGKSFEEIYDLMAVRIIVPSVKDCYSVLGAIHAMWKPLPGRFKDYIAMPKPNLYQSLHTTVITNFSSPFEIQIRTAEMHRIAEFGIAAHWKYKQGRTATSKDDIDDKIQWIREVLDSQKDLKDSHEFLDSLKIDLYTDNVFVFTPKGDVFSLPVGSTGVDFAYNIHSEVGNRCVGVKINSKMVPLSTKLETGDIVEVITSNSSKGPSRDWLKYVKTPSAKNKIRAFFKKEMKEENIHRGKELLEKEAKHRGYNFSDLISNKEWQEYVKNRYNISDLEDLFALVGYGDLTANQVIIKLIDYFNKDIQLKKPVIEIKETDKKGTKNSGGVLIKGFSDFLIRLSHCCTPVPGDKIIGYISRGRGVSIHRADCPNMKNVEPERVIEAQWPETINQKYATSLEIISVNRNNLLADISAVTSALKMGIFKINARVDSDRAIIELSVEINNSDELDLLIKKLGALDGVVEVFRSNVN